MSVLLSSLSVLISHLVRLVIKASKRKNLESAHKIIGKKTKDVLVKRSTSGVFKQLHRLQNKHSSQMTVQY
jgi:hypothetical protein